MAAIKRAVAKCQINETLVVSAGGPGIHEKQTGLTDLEGRFKTLVLSRYSSVQQAWSAFDVSSKGSLSRSDFKRVISTTLVEHKHQPNCDLSPFVCDTGFISIGSNFVSQTATR